MVDEVIKVTRRDIEEVFKNPRLVRAIESLINNTQYLVPEQINQLIIAIQESADSAASAQSAANAAEALSIRLDGVLQTLESSTADTAHVQPRDDGDGRISALEAQVAKLASEIDGLKQGVMA